VPPFRALVTDYPSDKNVFGIIDEYMIGGDILAAPLLAGTNSRKIYLPEGNWYDYNTNKKYPGGQRYTVDYDLDQIPIFIKEGSIIPFAKPVEYINANTVFEVVCNVYGAKASTSLFEDDGTTFDYENGTCNMLSLSYENGKGTVKRTGNYKKVLYKIEGWKHISSGN
jgi:alpha-D-xyloside xylohydrolase